jgi:hypothetical protein
MNDIKKETIGSFIVVDDQRFIRTIVVCQETFINTKGEVINSKNLYLERSNGEKIHRTEDPDVFKLNDGNILKKQRYR